MSSDRDLCDLPRTKPASAEPPAGKGPRETGKRLSPAGQFETELEMAERHVEEGAIRVARQREIVQQLHDRHANTELADTLLSQFEDMLAAQRAHLALLAASSKDPQDR